MTRLQYVRTRLADEVEAVSWWLRRLSERLLPEEALNEFGERRKDWLPDSAFNYYGERGKRR